MSGKLSCFDFIAPLSHSRREIVRKYFSYMTHESRIKHSFAVSKATTSTDRIQISQIYVYAMWNITTLRYLMSTLTSKDIHAIEHAINLTNTQIKAKNEELYQHKTFFVLFVFGRT